MVDLKGIYFSIEDKWYAFIDKLSDKLPFIGKSVDWVEEKGVPSFPLAILIVIILIFLLYFMLVGTGKALIIGAYDPNGDPIESAKVSIFLDGTIIDERETSADGKAIFFLEEKEYTVKIDKTGYKTQTRDLVKPTGVEERFGLALEDTLITKAISLKKANGNLISGSGIVRYTCVNNNQQKIGSYSNGIFVADFSDCSEIIIDEVSGYEIVEGSAFFSGTSNIILQEIISSTGTITVSINPSEDLEGLMVTARGEDGTPVQVRTISQETSTVIFEEMPTKKYYITTHSPQGNFLDYDGSVLGELKELRANETITFNITLQKSNSSTITINVKDFETGLPLTGAEVKLSSQNNNQLNTEMTGASGQIIFNVPDNTTYTVAVEHPLYLIGQTISVSSGQTRNFELVKANESNSQSLLIKVVDSKKEPIQNVKISLKKLDDSIVGEKTTGSNGETEFFNLELASYYAYAVKENFKGVTSSAVQIMPRRQNQLEITLDLGEGIFELEVLNESLEILRGVKVSAINHFTKELIEEKFTDEMGKTVFNVRADKKVYFVIESNEYSNYYTTAMYPNVGSTITKTIMMTKDSGKLNSRIIGIYLGGEEIGAERNIGSGIYNVKAILEIPKGNFPEAGIHFRTGKAIENTINLMEEDTAKIGKVESSANTIMKGTTYYPNNGYSIDSKNLTNNVSKWAEAKWTNIKEGVYEIEFELIIEDTPANTGINLWYRGWAKGSTTLRDPQNFNTGHEFYSSAKNYLLTSGATSLCKNNFCTSNEVKTLTGSTAGRIQFISNRFNATKDNSYELTTKIVSRKAMSNVVLNVEGNGLEIEKIIVNNSEQEGVINLGNLSIDSYAEVKVIFTTTNSGTNEIKMNLNSSIQNEFEQIIIVSVPANKKFTLDLIPRQIIPYITNILFFEVKDGNTPLKDVLIEIKSNNDVLETIKTNAEGIAQYELSEQSIGDTIYIRATKEGYNAFEIEKQVDDKLLIITPPEITNTIKIGEIASVEETILLENATVQKLKIEGVTTTGELNSFLNISFSEEVKGKEIAVGGDYNYTVKIKPNATAHKLKGPKTVEGTISIRTTVEGTTQVFESDIPVKIRLSMPGYLDSETCFKITPKNIEFNTSTKEVTQNIEIINDCTAEGIPLNLQEIEAKLSEQSKFGTISVSGTGFVNATLSDSFTKINDLFENSSKENLVIRFMPSSNIDTGKQKFEIIFNAKNVVEEQDSETIETKISVDITMSNLSKCIEIKEPAGGLTLEVAGWNLGQNKIMMNNLSAYAQNYQQQYQGFRNPTGMYGIQAMLPFMSPEGSSEYEQGNFIIENNCAVDIDFILTPDSRITVSEEKFTISSNNTNTITVSPGYTLGRYNVGVNAKISGTEEAKSKIKDVSVNVRKLGEIDKDCIKINVNKLTFNSFLYKAETYKVYNYCYNSGVYLNRNNAVTIKCDAPNAASQDVRYLQVGQEQLYAGQYPMQNNSYSQYFTPNGSDCGTNACALIIGTRTMDYRTIESQTGTIEEISFEVMPSTQYIPQRRLFDSQRNTYGLFQNLSDIRQWATETDARTGVYGTLNVSYSNQYGSQQCMTFPVTIEDNWRLLESVDSAINWGDPNARPEECVGSLEKTALDIVKYWKDRGNNFGNVPDAEFSSKGTYKHIAEPPAVKVGPGTSVQTGMPTYYTQYNMSNQYNVNNQYNVQQAKQNPLYTVSNAKNCGLLDSIDNLKYESSFGGVTIIVAPTKTGSLLNNTLGPNIWVEIDRTGIQHNCVYINTTVTGTLTRAINFQKGQITWPLKAIVTRPGFKPPQGFNAEKDCYNVGTGEIDCDKIIREIASSGKNAQQVYEQLLKEYPQCAQEYTQTQIDNLLKQETEKGSCTINPKEYGIDLIGKTNARELDLTELKNYCENNWCNNEMLQLFLMNKLNEIKKEITSIDSDRVRSGVMLSEIYKLAPQTDLNVCKNNTNTITRFYVGEDGQIIIEPIEKEKYLIENDKEIIVGAGEGALPLAQMVSVINRIKNSTGIDFEELFVQYNDETKTNYISAEAYLKLNEEVAKDILTTSVNVCGTKYDKILVEKISKGKPTLVRAIKTSKANINEKDKDLIYQKNTKLRNINLLARFDDDYANSGKSLYLTAENNVLPAYQKQLFNKIGEALNDVIEFKINAIGLSRVGKYKATIDGNTSKIIGSNADITLTLESKEDVNKSAQNIILNKGFNLQIIENTTMGNSKGTIIDSTGKFYQRTPVIFNVSLNAKEPIIKYSPQNRTSENTLIKWNYNGRIVNDSLSGTNYIVNTSVTSTAKQLKGLYYYPRNGSMTFETQNQDGATITGKTIIYNTGKTQTINIKGNKGLFELSTLEMPNLNQIIQNIKNNDACLTDNGNSIIWNEVELIKK